jgi:hypothetical protein
MVLFGKAVRACLIASIGMTALGFVARAEEDQSPLAPASELASLDAKSFAEMSVRWVREANSARLLASNRLAEGKLTDGQAAVILLSLGDVREDKIAAWCFENLSLTVIPSVSRGDQVDRMRPALWFLRRLGSGILDPLAEWLRRTARGPEALRDAAGLVVSVFGHDRVQPVIDATLMGSHGPVHEANRKALLAEIARQTSR